MTATTVTGAAPGSEVDWHSIDWAKAHQTVRRLQVRIAKVVRQDEQPAPVIRGFEEA